MPLDAILQYPRRGRELLDDRGSSGSDSLGFALSGRHGQVYNEAAFRHFLDLERKRSHRSGRGFFVLLVSLKTHGGATDRVPAWMTARLFKAVTESVREVDFVGWFRDQRVAGAVLAQGPEAPPADVRRQIAERVAATLRENLPAGTADRMRVRVLHARRRTTC
jgi:hypothetical protein